MTRGKKAVRGGAVLLVAVAGLGSWYWRRVSAPESPAAASPEEIARLENVREELREKIAALAAADPVMRQMPPGDVVVGMPVATATHLVQEATSGFLDEIELVLKNIKVHKDGDITVKKGLLNLKPGHYVLDLNVDEAHAFLKPGPPQVSFKNARFGVALSVALAKGVGRTTLGFQWKSQGVAGVLCDDFAVKEKLEGSVPARTYSVRGAFQLEVKRGRLVASPRFPAPGIVVDVSVEPSEEAWKFVDKVVEERPGGCEKVLKMIDLRKILTGILGKGFRITVPSKIFKPIDLPAGLEEEITVEGKTYALKMKPTQLTLTPDMLWYGSDVDASPGSRPPTP